MGSTINTKKLAPDKDLAIIGGFLKGLSQKKKDMEEAQLKEQELALKEYREKKQAEYWMRMAGAREQQVKAQAKRWEDMTDLDIENLTYKAMNARASLQNADANSMRALVERDKHNNRLTDEEYKTRLQMDAEKLKQIYGYEIDSRIEALRHNYQMIQIGKQTEESMKRTKETTGTQRDIASANISAGFQRLGAEQDFDKWKTQFEESGRNSRDKTSAGSAGRLSPTASDLQKRMAEYRSRTESLAKIEREKDRKLVAGQLYDELSDIINSYKSLPVDEQKAVGSPSGLRPVGISPKGKLIFDTEVMQNMYGVPTIQDYIGAKPAQTTQSSSDYGNDAIGEAIRQNLEAGLKPQEILDTKTTPRNKEEVRKRLGL